MKYCKNCGNIVTDDNLDICPKCQGELVSSLKKEEASQLSKIAHSNDICEYNKTQNAMCYVVLGGISLVVGVLFIFLSLKKKVNKIVGINVNSLQFYICIICLAIGVVCLAYGLIRLFMALNKRKIYKKEIALLNSVKTSD